MYRVIIFDPTKKWPQGLRKYKNNPGCCPPNNPIAYIPHRATNWHYHVHTGDFVVIDSKGIAVKAIDPRTYRAYGCGYSLINQEPY